MSRITNEGVKGRPAHRWENNIKMDHREKGFNDLN
jgi:hypothetical protein